jgi:hypothetical protein
LRPYLRRPLVGKGRPLEGKGRGSRRGRAPSTFRKHYVSPMFAGGSYFTHAIPSQITCSLVQSLMPVVPMAQVPVCE